MHGSDNKLGITISWSNSYNTGGYYFTYFEPKEEANIPGGGVRTIKEEYVINISTYSEIVDGHYALFWDSGHLFGISDLDYGVMRRRLRDELVDLVKNHSKLKLDISQRLDELDKKKK